MSGRITDETTGEALMGVNLFVPSLGLGTVTRESGFYSLTLPAQAVELQVSYLGYRPQVIPLEAGDNRRLDLELTRQIIGLESIEVYGAEEAAEEITTTQMSAVTLPVEDLKALPAFMGEVDVLKSLQLLPGVQSGVEGSTGLYVRGGGPDQNLILLDGAPIYNASHIFGFLSVFNPDALQHVQLIKGGFPARYGGRLSSVVDLRMKEGNFRNYEVEGAIGIVFSSLTIQGPFSRNRASFVASARRTYIDLLARPFLNRRLPEGSEISSYFYDTNARVDVRVTDKSSVALSFYAGQDAYGSTNESRSYRGAYLYRQRHTSEADWGNASATLRWKQFFGDRLFGTAALSYTRYRFGILTRLAQIEERTPPAETSEEINYGSGVKDRTVRLDFDYYPAPSQTLRFGANVTRHAFNPGVSSLELRLTATGVTDTTLTPHSYPFETTEGYLYLEDDLEISDRIKTNLGVHVSGSEIQGRVYTSIQPRISVRYLVNPFWSLKTSFGTMQQYLHLLTNTGINLPTDLWLASTERIQPQQAWQAAAGAAFQFAGDRFSATLEGYYKSMKGLLEYEPGASFISPNQDWQDLVVTGSGTSYGIELLVRKKQGRTTGWIGYTLSWSNRQFPALNEGRPFPYRYDRRHDLSVVLSHRFKANLDVGLTWVYGTGQALTLASSRFYDARLLDVNFFNGRQAIPELRQYGPRGGFRMAAYHRLDISISWHFENALFLSAGEGVLSVGAYNAYSRKNPFFLFTITDPDGSRQYQQASLFPVLPFISYRFAF